MICLVRPESLLAPAPRLSRSGTQCWPVEGYIPHRFLVTYRAKAQELAPLVPLPFELDTLAGYGFLSVCAVEIQAMGLVGTPRWLHFDNTEFLYRLAVRLHDKPTFITLRSDVGSRALALLGRFFSHYRPHLAKFSNARHGVRHRMLCVTPDGIGDGSLDLELSNATHCASSVFADAESASEFLLGMSFSADVVKSGRVRVQRIEHSPWDARFAHVKSAHFQFIQSLGAQYCTRFELDNVLGMTNISQVWRAAQWL